MSLTMRLLLVGLGVCLAGVACQDDVQPRLTLLSTTPPPAVVAPTAAPTQPGAVTAALATPTRAPVATAAPTLTPILPTPAATTSAELPAPTPIVQYFRANVDTADPGQTITLAWSTANATQIAIYHVFDGRLGEPSWNVGASGSLDYTIGAQERNGVVFMLFAGDGGSANAQATVTVRLRCTAQWFFSAPPDICPQDWALSSPAAEQRFEHGVMLWVWAEDRVYVLFDDGSPRWKAVTDEFDDGEPESDPALVPPAGLVQPVRGFGRIWREEPGVRERLGWAMASESGFTTFIQRTSYSRYNSIFLQALDGAIYHLGPEGGSWEKRAP